MEKDRAHNIKIDMAESEVNLQHVMQERKHHRHWLKILSFAVGFNDRFNNREGVIIYKVHGWAVPYNGPLEHLPLKF